MSTFNFNSLNETSFVNNNPQYLRAYDIYQVNLTKIEKTTLKGKNGTDYSVVAVEFTGCGDNKGIFTNNIFIPNKEEDFERRANSTSGQSYPSAMENYQFTLMQILQVINPEHAKKVIANASKIKTVDQFTDLIIKGLADKKDVVVYLKLVGRNSGGTVYAALPNACILPKDATPETKPVALNFISTDRNKLQFSNYELSQMKKYNEAAPTKMKDESSDEEETEEDSLDGLDDLL